MTRHTLLALALSVALVPLARGQEPSPSAETSPDHSTSDAEASADAASAKDRLAFDRHNVRNKAEESSAVAALEAANAELKTAQAAQTAAEADLQLAIASVDSATAATAAAEAALTSATEAAEAAEAAAEAEGATAEQTEAAAAAREAASTAEVLLTEAKGKAESAEQTRAKAEDALEAAQAVVEKAQKKADTARAEVGQVRSQLAASAAARTAMEEVAATPRGAAMPTEMLKLRIQPLTQEELVTESDAWLEVLKNLARNISYADIASRAAEGPKKEIILEALTGLRERRTKVVDRFEIVLAELERKGGDPLPYRRYMAAITGLQFDTGDVSATWVALSGWVTSPEGGIRWGLNVLKFILTLLAFRVLGSFVGGLLRRALSSGRVKTSELLKDFFVNVTRKAIGFLGIVVALSMVEVNVTPFLAAMGGGALVIGLALQGTLSNFAAGVMILMYRPYDIGDVVSVAGVTGKVDAMSLVATSLRTPDNQLVVVPNGSIWGGIITNVTGTPRRRVDLVFGIGYGDDIAKAEEIMADILSKHEKVLKDPAPVIKLFELADSSVNFVCRPWCKTADYWDVLWDVTREVKLRFDAEGVSIPFPQTDVHVHQTSAT